MILRANDEAVEMIAEKYRFLPHLFRWRGRCFEVEAVERCWTVVRRRRTERNFRVLCSTGEFELCHDLSSGAWCLRSVKAQSAPASAVPIGRHRWTEQLAGTSPGQVLRRRALKDMGRAWSMALGACRFLRVCRAEGG